jgi:hypothetical protein
MAARLNVRPHGHLQYPIDELSLGAAVNKHGLSIELDVYAYGEAEIAYDRDGDWEIVGLQIAGHRRNYGGWPTWLKDVANLPRDHPLYPLIVTALHEAAWQGIDKRVAKALAEGREVV